jgi:hypothetical protein
MQTGETSMNWIDMSDVDKLFNYAKEFKPDKFRIFVPNENADSYYHDCENSCNIMEYNIERFDTLKKTLLDMWDNAGFKNPELLATMVSAMTLKNMPVKKEPKQQEKAKKESYESVNADDAPSVFVYEF